MSYLLKGFLRLFKYIPQIAKISKFIPISFAGIFIITNFIVIIFNQGITHGFAYLAQSVFGAGLTINQNVWLAMQDSPEYTLKAFIAILVSLYVIYSFVKLIAKIQVKFSGAQASWSAAIFAIVILAFIQMATIYGLEGQFGWLPIRDDIIFLFKNISPVLHNIW